MMGGLSMITVMLIPPLTEYQWQRCMLCSFFSKHRLDLKQTMQSNNITFACSIRMPLIMLGQDEVIFKQFIMNLMEWRGRKGEMATKPKDQGQGLMGSGINAREFGYGWKLSAEELDVVNTFR